MHTQLHSPLALELVRERTRAVEARARLAWGVEPEPSLERGVTAPLEALCRTVSRTPSGRDERCRLFETAATQQPSGGVPA